MTTRTGKSVTDIFATTAAAQPLESRERARARAVVRDEEWLAVALTNRQTQYLERIAAEIRAKTGKIVKRPEIIRAIIDTVDTSGVDLTTTGPWASSRFVRVAGIDRAPGVVAIALVENNDGVVEVVDASIVETAKKPKRFCKKAPTDDHQRLADLWTAMVSVLDPYHADALAIEDGSDRTCGLLHSMALHYQSPLFGFSAEDLRTLSGKRRSKIQAIGCVLKEVKGLSDLMDRWPQPKQRHLAYAAGYAVLAIRHLAAGHN